MPRMMRFEICAGGVESCIAAENAGANRVELCSALSEGGITPSFSVVEYCVKNLTIELNVIIRPRGGDFVYTSSEIEIMRRDIEVFKSIGVNGVVVGCLNNDGSVDVDAMRILMEAANGLSVTFHRAFDICANPFDSLETIISLGCDRILTSGHATTAYEGRDMLKQLNEKSSGRIIIMPGCGVDITNVSEIVDYTKVNEIHFSASVVRSSLFLHPANGVNFGASPSLSDEKKIREIISLFR